MPLALQTIDVPFATGVDQKTDQRLVQLGTQTSVLNGRFTKSGVINKRYGSIALSKTAAQPAGIGGAWGVLSSGATVESWRGSPVVSDGNHLFTYAKPENTLVFADALSECIATRSPVAQGTSGVLSSDCASTNGYNLYAYQAVDAAGVTHEYATVLDAVTGSQIGAQTSLDTSSQPGVRCFAIGTLFYVVWQNGSNNLMLSTFQTAIPTPQWSTPVSIANLWTSAQAGIWDVGPNLNATGGQNIFFAVYQSAASTVAITGYNVSGGPLASTSFTLGGPISNTHMFGVAMRANQTFGVLWISYDGTDGINSYIRNIGVNTTLTGSAPDPDTALFQQAGVALHKLGVEIINSTTCITVSSVAQGADNVAPMQYAQRNGGGVLGARTLPHYQMHSKPLLYNGTCYCVVWHTEDYGILTTTYTPQLMSGAPSPNCAFNLVDLLASDTANDGAMPRPVATLAPRQASTSLPLVVTPNLVQSSTTGQLIAPIHVQQSVSRIAVHQAVFDFISPKKTQSCELGGTLYMSGGIPSAFDGATVAEIGFTAPPSMPFLDFPVTVGGHSGSLGITSGGYQWAIVYKWVNAQGELVRSAPVFSNIVSTAQSLAASVSNTFTFSIGPPHTITASVGGFLAAGFAIGQQISGSGFTSNNGVLGVITGLTDTMMTFASGLINEGPDSTGTLSVTATQSATIQVWSYPLTTRQEVDNGFSPAVTFDLYRNTVADPATFWQVFSDAMETPSLPSTLTTVTLTDGIPDTQLTSQAFSVLYTLGGVLPDQCPPSLTCLTVHQNRLVGVGDDGLTLYFTKQYVSGFSPSFNDQLTLVCPADGGQIQGLASMDGTLYVFKADRIFRLDGTGWDNTGQGAAWSDFNKIPSDVGCIQTRSLVTGPMGTFFQSYQGLSLLSRAGEVVYVGRPVEDTVAANPICFAADIVSPLGEIRWALGPSVTSSTGTIVCFNYVTNAWSVHQYYDTDQAVNSAVVRGAKAPGGNWVWIGAGGQVSLESSTTYLDNTQWVPLQVETAWIKANGILGWGRFWRARGICVQNTPFQLTLDIGFNYGPYTQSFTFTDQIIQSWNTPQPEFMVGVGQQKSPAIRMRLTDSAPTTLGVGTGQGSTYVGFNVDIGVMPKGVRLPAQQRA